MSAPLPPAPYQAQAIGVTCRACANVMRPEGVLADVFRANAVSWLVRYRCIACAATLDLEVPAG
jgi:hypothetical protein